MGIQAGERLTVTRPALRPDPRERQRRRRGPRRRRLEERPDVRRADERAGRGPRARQHLLRQPGRPRRAAELLERRRPGRADEPAAGHPGVREDRRIGDPHDDERQRTAQPDHPQHAPQPRPDRGRGQDRATRSAPATCWSGRRPATGRSSSRRCSARAARPAATPRPRSSWTTASRSTSHPPPSAADEELADPKLDYRDERLALVAAKAIEVSAREGQPVDVEVDAPDEVSGAIEQGEPLGSVTVTVDGRRADRVALVAAESVEAATTTDKVLSFRQEPLRPDPAGVDCPGRRHDACSCRKEAEAGRPATRLPGPAAPEATAQAPIPSRSSRGRGSDGARRRRRSGLRRKGERCTKSG